LSRLVFINHIALGAIALAIGSELEWKRVKVLGRGIFFIVVFEALGAFAIVTTGVYLIWHDLSLAFIFGSVSSATAPAATVAVIQQYKSRGPLTKTILAVVGIDDAISFIIFAFALALVKGNLQGSAFDITQGIVAPLIELAISVSIGLVLGFIGARLMASSRDQEAILFILGALILWISTFANKLDASELIAAMTAGIMIVNIYPNLRNRMRKAFSAFMPLFYALFFIIGGAHLHLESLPVVWFLSIVYFLLRSAGKIVGAFTGAQFARSLPKIKNYIGFALLPQVGAAIALALVVQDEFGSGAYGVLGQELASKTFNVLLITTLLTEFIGPYLTKMLLVKAGEAKA
ncbi:MAG: cation:proton antiporter, partial [Candidatus Latescibacteria bacterium]|nr:cation:proton antiporter [Candidatus Latescibacterota bacterium]